MAPDLPAQEISCYCWHSCGTKRALSVALREVAPACSTAIETRMPAAFRWLQDWPGHWNWLPPAAAPPRPSSVVRPLAASHRLRSKTLLQWVPSDTPRTQVSVVLRKLLQAYARFMCLLPALGHTGLRPMVGLAPTMVKPAGEAHRVGPGSGCRPFRGIIWVVVELLLRKSKTPLVARLMSRARRERAGVSAPQLLLAGMAPGAPPPSAPRCGLAEAQRTADITAVGITRISGLSLLQEYLDRRCTPAWKGAHAACTQHSKFASALLSTHIPVDLSCRQSCRHVLYRMKK